jgi:hypothetical protein
VSLGLEGRAADQELVHEHAQAPHVHPLVVLLALNTQHTTTIIIIMMMTIIRLNAGAV